MTIKKRIAALAVAGAMVAGFVGVSASAAQAAEIPGTITITPTSGNVNTDTVFLDSIKVSIGATAPNNLAVGTFVYQGGVELGAVSNLGTAGMVATNGANSINGVAPIGGFPVNMDRSINPTNVYVSNKLLSGLATPLTTGSFELRYYWFDSTTSPNRATSPYVKLAMTYNATTGAWALDVPATPTSVSLTASTTANAGEVSLSASVKDLAGAAVIAGVAGNIVFKEGTNTVSSVPVASGIGSALLTGVADGTHSYTAEFQSSNTTYSNSTSGAASVILGAAGTATSTIQVAIPAGIGTLTLTGVSSTVNLGTAVLAGGTLNAHGTLNSVVTDTRQLEYPAWSLTGVVGDFVSGTNTLSGKYLGWEPAVAGDATNSVAGADVLPAPGTTNGLKTSSELASGEPFDGGTITNASAELQLKAPSNTRAGAYSATLTLTLI